MSETNPPKRYPYKNTKPSKSLDPVCVQRGMATALIAKNEDVKAELEQIRATGQVPETYQPPLENTINEEEVRQAFDLPAEQDDPGEDEAYRSLDVDKLLATETAQTARQLYAASHIRLLKFLVRRPQNYTEARDQAMMSLGVIKHLETRNLELLQISTTERDVKMASMVRELQQTLAGVQEYKNRRAPKIVDVEVENGG